MEERQFTDGVFVRKSDAQAEIARLTAALEGERSETLRLSEMWQIEYDHAKSLTAERDALRAAIFGGANYASDLRNGNFVEMAQTLHAAQKGGLARAEKAEADLATARAEMAMAYDRKNVEAQISEGVGAILRKFCESDHAAKARHHLHAMPDSDWNTLVSMLADAVVSTTAHATEALAADRKAVRAETVAALINVLHCCDTEAQAIASRIAGPRGMPNQCPDGVQVLEDAETIIRAAAVLIETDAQGGEV